MTQSINLVSVNLNFSLILSLILLYRIRNIYIFKISFFKFHYVMMSENNFSYKINNNYKFIYLPAYNTFKYTIYLNYIMLLGLILVMIYFLTI